MNNPNLNDLPAYWPADILEQYLQGVWKDQEMGADEDDAMSTDSESDSIFEEGSSITMSGDSNMSDISVIHHPDDIASDDSAFSSEDEFASDAIRDDMRVRRELVLGRPALTIVNLDRKELRDMHQSYMKQLDDADLELEELRAIARHDGAPIEAMMKTMAFVGIEEEVTLELRKRSSNEIFETDRKLLVHQLVLLAQSLFRKERLIKGFVR